MIKLKHGFTLAEVLIAIGIVGVVSALMMNLITHKRPNQNKAMFRKAYYIIEREASAMAMDDDNFPTEIEGSKRLAYFDASINPDDESVGQYDDKNNIRRTYRNTGRYFCRTFANALNTMGDVECYDKENDPEYTAHDFESGKPTFVTNDGIYWYITPNIICDPTDQEAIAKYKDQYDGGACDVGDINDISNPDANDPPCPTSIEEVRPFVCVYFDVDGPEVDNHPVNNPDVVDKEMVSPTVNPDPDHQDVPYAARGYVYVYWNGKVKAPAGQTSRYLKSVTVL